jgi:hypothetical protein
MAAETTTPAQATPEAGKPTTTETAKADPGAATATQDPKNAVAGSDPKAAAAGAAGGDGKAADAVKPGAAQDVELKFPEGVKVNPKLVDAYKAKAKEFGLDSAKAQAIANLVVEDRRAEKAAFEQQSKEQDQKWMEALRADKEIGGAELEKNRAIAAKAIERFGSAELRKILEASGLGNHPDMVRAFVRAGKAISEDRIAGTAGTPGAPSDPDGLRARYPSNFKSG